MNIEKHLIALTKFTDKLVDFAEENRRKIIDLENEIKNLKEKK